MATHDTKLGIGYESGMFYHAPAGTSLPTYPTETLETAWKEVGDVSGDGITLTLDKSTENLRNWANKIKRVIVSEHTETVQAPIMDTTEETLTTMLGEDAVSHTAATSGHGKLVTASLSQDKLPEEEAFLFIMKDGDDMLMLGTSKGIVREVGDISFAPTGGITWEATIEAASWTFAKDDGTPTT